MLYKFRAWITKREQQNQIEEAGWRYAMAAALGDKKRAERMRMIIDKLESK